MSFRFDSILRLNKNKENLLQRDMGQINALHQKQQGQKDFMQETRDKSKNELNDRKRSDINVQSMILYDNFFKGIKSQGVRQDTIISEITTKLEAKRGEVVEAMRKRRTLEILKEHHMRKERKARERKETAIQDEVASNLWSRNL